MLTVPARNPQVEDESKLLVFAVSKLGLENCGCCSTIFLYFYYNRA